MCMSHKVNLSQLFFLKPQPKVNLQPKYFFSILQQNLLLLPHDELVSLQVTHVDDLSLLNDIRMRCQEQPADVREEKTALCIMRVGICLGVFVVDSMVVRPSVSIALKRKGIELWWIIFAILCLQRSRSKNKFCRKLQLAIARLSTWTSRNMRHRFSTAYVCSNYFQHKQTLRK